MQNSSVLMGSLKEISEAYHLALVSGVDVAFWKQVYCERLVMVCDSIKDCSGVGGVDRYESQRGRGAL